MRRHAKASTAGSTKRQATGLGRLFSLAAIAALSLCALVAFTAPVASAEPPEPLSSFGPDGTPESSFERLGSIGADQQDGSVYALDERAGVLSKFAPNGQPVNFEGISPYINGNRIEGLLPFNSEVAIGASQVAVNPESHVFYVTEQHAVRAFQANGEPAEFSAGPGKDTSEIPGFTKLYGVAVDANGNIYASDNAGTLSVFAPSGAAITSFAVTEPHNLAVAANGTVYVVELFSGGLSAVKKFAPSEFPVTEATTYAESTFTPAKGFAEIPSIAVDPSSQDVYLLETLTGAGAGAWIRRYDPSGALVESIGEPTEPGEAPAFGAASQGLAVLGVEREIGIEEKAKLYVADTPAFDDSHVAILGTRIVVGAPSTEDLRVTDVTADSAVLRASINPNTKASSYHFEYGVGDCGLGGCTSVPADGASIGEGHAAVPVSQAIPGLSPSTTYHYRLIAENELGVTVEDGGTFTTQSVGTGFGLSDNRAWEMVSPPNKHSATLVGARVGLIQAAADGSRISYISRGSMELGPEGNRNLEPASVLAERGPGGWVSKDISPPNVRAIPMATGGGSEYKLFSPNLERALLDPRDGTGLSPAASERTPYVRENSTPPVYTPLVTGKEGFANVPPGTEFGREKENTVNPYSKVRLRGSNQSLNHLILFSEVSLLPGQPDASFGLYYWTENQLQPVSVLPEAEGGEFTFAQVAGSGPGSVTNAISEDGSRIFWATGTYHNAGNSLTALYLHDTESEESVRLDLARSDASGLGESRPAFQGASSDGSVVYFVDSEQLSADASPSGFDLYRCEIPLDDPSLGCATLTNLTAPEEGSGESAEVLGLAAGVSEDGSTIYFVAEGSLDAAANGHGDTPVPGQPNLYGWRQGSGLRFIATLSDQDSPDWGGDVGRSLALSSTLSPSGRYLAFMSQEEITGQSNRDAETGKPVQHAYRYDAATDQLHCVSCNPSGAAPRGERLGESARLVDPREQWLDKYVAATLPQPSILETDGISLYRPRAVLDNGRVFFNAIDALVPADSNNEWDVYQFEPVGVGSCKAFSSSSASARSGPGCISLISSGTGEEESGLLDASASGDDVFFLTPSQLSVTDEDLELDVYDARVDGVAATLAPSTECLGEACQPAALAPNDPTPASAGFRGKGDPKPKARKRCAKGKRKVRRSGKVRCIARKQSKRAGQSGRAGR